jgi:threonine/homoserine/homoserine lactone efflux protein
MLPQYIQPSTTHQVRHIFLSLILVVILVLTVAVIIDALENMGSPEYRHAPYRHNRVVNCA